MLKVFPKNGFLPIAAGAVGAGFLNGLLGAGGGIILYFCLAHAYKNEAKENLIVSSVSVMFFCLISLFFYKGNASLEMQNIVNICLPAATGGLLGAVILKRLSVTAVKKLFAAIMIMSGIITLTR